MGVAWVCDVCFPLARLSNVSAHTVAQRTGQTVRSQRNQYKCPTAQFSLWFYKSWEIFAKKVPFFETEINQDRDERKDQFVPREINTFLHLLLLLRTCPRGQISPKLTFSQTHLSEMNPRRAKQVINTFPSLSCSNYCAIFHLYNVQFSTSLGVSSATCVRTFLRLPTIFSVLLSPPQGKPLTRMKME